jgi:hypothetical protein
MIPPLFGKQEVGIWRVEKRFPRYGVPIWSLWPNIRFLPSIVAEKNVTKNVHICSMCIKINKVGKQEVGIWWVQKRFPQYGIPIWHLWPNIRFLPSTVTEKNATKNILDGRTEVKQYTPLGERGYNKISFTLVKSKIQLKQWDIFFQENCNLSSHNNSLKAIIWLTFFFRFMVFNTTFNNISAISWWSVLMVEETGVLGENRQPVASLW